MRGKQFFVLIFLFLLTSKSSFANNLELTKLLQCQDNKAVVLEQFKNSKHVVDGEMMAVYRAKDNKSRVFESPIKYMQKKLLKLKVSLKKFRLKNLNKVNMILSQYKERLMSIQLSTTLGL